MFLPVSSRLSKCAAILGGLRLAAGEGRDILNRCMVATFSVTVVVRASLDIWRSPVCGAADDNPISPKRNSLVIEQESLWPGCLIRGLEAGTSSMEAQAQASLSSDCPSLSAPSRSEFQKSRRPRKRNGPTGSGCWVAGNGIEGRTSTTAARAVVCFCQIRT